MTTSNVQRGLPILFSISICNSSINSLNRIKLVDISNPSPSSFGDGVLFEMNDTFGEVNGDDMVEAVKVSSLSGMKRFGLRRMMELSRDELMDEKDSDIVEGFPNKCAGNWKERQP